MGGGSTIPSAKASLKRTLMILVEPNISKHALIILKIRRDYLLSIHAFVLHINDSIHC